MSLKHRGGALAAAICLAVFAEVHSAEAAIPDQPCTEVGATAVSDDQHNMLACLYNGSHNLVWTGLAAPARPASASSSPSSRWQGWYAGGNVGVVDANTSFNQSTNGLGSGYALQTYGVTTGLVGGYNTVRTNGLFYGGEVDINYMSDSRNSGSGVSGDETVDWNGYSTVRGRVGIAFDPALVFLSGGLALGDVVNKVSGEVSNSQIQVGWTAGAGAEFGLTDKLSMSVQYLRLEMPENIQNGAGANHVKWLMDNSANILRTGLNWHFD